MIITLDSKTHPEVEIMKIDIEHATVDFKNSDGLCMCPYTAKDNIPTEAELKTAIEATLG